MMRAYQTYEPNMIQKLVKDSFEVDGKTVSLKATYQGRDKMNQKDRFPMNKWTVTLTYQEREFSFPFHMGVGIQHGPTAESVLGNLCMNASSIENVRSFEEWAGDFGYDEDSRKAEATYHACWQEARQTKALLGSDYLWFVWEWESDER